MSKSRNKPTHAPRPAKRSRRSPARRPPQPAGYSGTPLVRKLGVKSGQTVAIVEGPSDFDRLLVDLPDGVVLRNSDRGRRDLTIWFVSSAARLRSRIERMAQAVEAGAIWIAWPKKASGVKTDVTEGLVRQAGLDHGLVDFKICAVDHTWSALKFCHRRS